MSRRDAQGVVVPEYKPTPEPLVRPQEIGVPRKQAITYTPTYEVPLDISLARTALTSTGKSQPILGDAQATLACRAVLVIAKSTNVANLDIEIRASGVGSGIDLPPGAGLRIPISDAGKIYFSGTAGDIVMYVVEIAPI